MDRVDELVTGPGNGCAVGAISRWALTLSYCMTEGLATTTLTQYKANKEKDMVSDDQSDDWASNYTLVYLLRDKATGRLMKAVAEHALEDAIVVCARAKESDMLTGYDLALVFDEVRNQTQELFRFNRQRDNDIGRTVALDAWQRYRAVPPVRGSRREHEGRLANDKFMHVLARTSVDVGPISRQFIGRFTPVTELAAAVNGLLSVTGAASEALVGIIQIEETLGDQVLVSDSVLIGHCKHQKDALRDALRAVLGMLPSGDLLPESAIYDICIQQHCFDVEVLLQMLEAKVTVDGVFRTLLARKALLPPDDWIPFHQYKIVWPFASEVVLDMARKLGREMDKFRFIEARLDAWRDGMLTCVVSASADDPFHAGFAERLSTGTSPNARRLGFAGRR